MTAVPSVELRPAAKNFLGCPYWENGKQYDVVFIGVPSDHGTLGVRSTIFGPATLRAASSAVGQRLSDSNHEAGWFDYFNSRVLLSGITMADAGDFPVDRRIGLEQFDLLPSVLQQLSLHARVMVLFGGDDSILYWLAKTCETRALLILDAHEDATPIDGTYPHHGNVVSFIDQMSFPAIVLQHGLRGIVPDRRMTPPSKRIICRTHQDVIDAVRRLKITELAVSVDVDVFSPRIVDAVCARSPGGAAPEDMVPLFEALTGQGVQINFLSFMEFAPDKGRDADTALILVQFIMRVLDLAVRSL
jgi:arginase family enzyme